MSDDKIHIAVPGVHIRKSGKFTYLTRMNACLNEKIIFHYIGYNYPDDNCINLIKNMGGFFAVFPKCNIPLLKLIVRLKFLVGYLKDNKCKICYINSSNAIHMMAYALVGYIVGIQFRIGHSHSSGTGIEQSINVPKFLHSLFKKILPIFLTHYLTCSDKATEWMYPKNVINKGNVLKINNSIDISTYYYSIKMRENKKTELNISTNLLIGHVGKFQAVKNHDFILKIFKEILVINENAILFLIGDGPLFEKIQEEANKLNIINKIIFYGSTKEVHEYLQIFDVFLLPSHFEGLPIVGIEAQSTGLPCFFSDVITKEVNITNNCHFLSLKEKPAYWAEKIIEISKSFIRKDCSDIVRQAGYEIKESAKILEQLFVSCTDEQNH